MRQWSIRVSLLIGSIVLAPILVELPIAYVKGENFNLDRALAVIAIIFGALGAVFLGGILSHRFRLILLIALMVDGVATTVLGVVIILADDPSTAGAEPLSMTALVSGIFVFGAALYLAYSEGQSVDLALPKGKEPSFDVASVQHGAATGDGPVGVGPINVGPINYGRSASVPRVDEQLVTSCRAKLDPEDLHFVALYTEGACQFFVDVLDHQVLDRFFLRTTPSERRRSYERAGRQLNLLMSRLNRHLEDVEGGILIRTVLDVEKGALYYYWVTPRDYLIGVTLDQTRVDVADLKMARLVDELRRHYSLPPINQREAR